MIINFFRFIDKAFAVFVEALLIAILLTMVAVIFIQIILRNFFASGFSWADVGSRHAVLWITFLGAMLATRARGHLNIDAITRLLPKKERNTLRVLLDAFAAFVCFMLTKAALVFVMDERVMDATLFLGIKTWMVLAIIPFGFAMMAVEYCIGVVLDILRIFDPTIQKRHPDDTDKAKIE